MPLPAGVPPSREGVRQKASRYPRPPVTWPAVDIHDRVCSRTTPTKGGHRATQPSISPLFCSTRQFNLDLSYCWAFALDLCVRKAHDRRAQKENLLQKKFPESACHASQVPPSLVQVHRPSRVERKAGSVTTTEVGGWVPPLLQPSSSYPSLSPGSPLHFLAIACSSITKALEIKQPLNLKSPSWLPTSFDLFLPLEGRFGALDKAEVMC
jgi:hypothetical protein